MWSLCVVYVCVHVSADAFAYVHAQEGQRRAQGPALPLSAFFP